MVSTKDLYQPTDPSYMDAPEGMEGITRLDLDGRLRGTAGDCGAVSFLIHGGGRSHLRGHAGTEPGFLQLEPEAYGTSRLIAPNR